MNSFPTRSECTPFCSARDNLEIRFKTLLFLLFEHIQRFLRLHFSEPHSQCLIILFSGNQTSSSAQKSRWRAVGSRRLPTPESLIEIIWISSRDGEPDVSKHAFYTHRIRSSFDNNFMDSTSKMRYNKSSWKASESCTEDCCHR